MAEERSRSVPVSAVVLAKDEELFIARCLESLAWADEIVVLDSGSTDRTCEIARGLGAVVFEQPWLGWVAQHDKAVSLATHDWVLCIDSDEIVTPQLRRSIIATFDHPMDPHDGYALDRRGDFLGVLLPNQARRSKREGFVRLFNRTHSHHDPAMIVHEEVLVPGRRIPLDGTLLHWRGYDMDQYVTVFNRYATLEAEASRLGGDNGSAYLIALRPAGRFLWCYVRKGEWRLGTRGLIHAMLKAFAEFIHYAKLWETAHRPESVHPPDHIYPVKTGSPALDVLAERP